jgi:SAM-dependent methyltransferase
MSRREVAFLARNSQYQLFHAVSIDQDAPVSVGALRPLSDLSVYSQNNEDGLLLVILRLIGHQGLILDVGCGNPMLSNSANLLLHWGYSARLVDSSRRRVRRAAKLYAARAETRWADVELQHARVSPDNVESLVGHVHADILMLDIDGLDYWLLRRWDFHLPRIVLVEFQEIFDFDCAVAVDPRSRDVGRSWYFGASLRAFCDMLQLRGYQLVAVDRGGFNAFFVRDCDGLLEPVDPQSLGLGRPSTRRRAARIARIPKQRWINV